MVANTSLWHCFVERGDSSSRTAMVQALLRERVRTRALLPSELVGPGIVFFEKVNPAVCDLVRQCSRNGLERVLAVAVSQSALAGNSVWLLLHSGASDVFAWDHST